MPTAGNEVTFAVKGPGKIIGVGNGDPGCHEADKIFDKYDFIKINDLRYKSVANQGKLPELAPDFDDSAWPLHIHRRNQKSPAMDSLIVIRGVFELPLSLKNRKFTLFGKSLCQDQTLYINGRPIAEKVKREAPNQVYPLAGEILQPGKNVFTVVGYPLTKRHQWEELNTDPGIIQMITPHSQWKRSAFNGLAQVILQSEKNSGRILLTARSKNLTPASIEIFSEESDEKKK
jgi:beta-galactosidase